MVGPWLRIHMIAHACIAIGLGVEGFSGVNTINGGVRNVASNNCQVSRIMGEKKGWGGGMNLECSKVASEVDSSRHGGSMRKNNEIHLQEPHGGKLVNLMVQSEAEKQVRGYVVAVIVVLGRSSSAIWVIIT